MNRSNKNRMIFSSLMILGALAYGQHATADCGNQAADQAALVPKNFTAKKFDSGSYFNAPGFANRSCKSFIVDVSLNANSNNDGKKDRRIEMGSGPQNLSTNYGPADATKATCANYVLTESFYAKEQGAPQFSYKGYAQYQGVWVDGGLFAPSCGFKTIKTFIFGAKEPPLSGVPTATYRVATKLTEKKKDTSGKTYEKYHSVSVSVYDFIQPPR